MEMNALTMSTYKVTKHKVYMNCTGKNDSDILSVVSYFVIHLFLVEVLWINIIHLFCATGNSWIQMLIDVTFK